MEILIHGICMIYMNGASKETRNRAPAQEHDSYNSSHVGKDS